MTNKYKKTKYFNLSYGEKVPGDFLISGVYNKNSCGGACDWSITYRPMEDAIYSTEYNGEKYFYVFSFYKYTDKSSELYKLMMRLFPCAKDMGNGEYIALCNLCESNDEMEKIYDHENETVIDVDPDEFGGLIYFSFIE